MMALFIGVMLLTIAPMVVYAIQKPDIFFGRLAEVTRPEDAVTLWESVVLHARMFFIAGDPYVRYNIPARPYFTLPEGIILMLGVGVCLYRIARGRGDAAARTGYLLALLSPLMIVPSVISVSGLPPSHMRSLGMIPLIFVLLGVGVEWLTSRVRERMTASPDSLSVLERRQGGEVALILVLLIGGLSVGTLYFDWATRADVYYETDADLSAAARWLAAGADGDLTDTVIYLAARDKGHPTAMIEAIPPVRWIGTDTLFRAPPTMDGLYVFPRSAPPVEEWRAWLEPGRITDLPLAPDGRTAFEAFRLSGATMLPIQAPSETVRNPYMTLLGIDAPPIPSGEADWVTTFWQVDAVPPFADFTPLISLEDEAGEVFRGDAYMTETDRWLPGEVMVLRLRVSVPIGTPPARYALSIRWIGRASDQFVNTIGGGVSARVGTLLVARALAFPDPATLDIPVRCADCTVNEGVALLGWNPLPTTLRPGAGFVLTTVWHALRDQPQNPISLLFGTDDAPLLPHYAVDYRPNRWTRGEIMMVRARYQIPSTLQSGSYEIRLQGRDAVISLGSVSVEGIARRYDAPPVDGRSEVVFGNAIALYGYTLEHSADAFHVALVWRADAPIDRDYSVFVHRLDTEGNIIDQRDAQPANGATPTSLWLPGEYIIDNYTFSPDDRVIALRIGLYTPDDGQRLRVDMGGDFALIPLDSASP